MCASPPGREPQGAIAGIPGARYRRRNSHSTHRADPHTSSAAATRATAPISISTYLASRGGLSHALATRAGVSSIRSTGGAAASGDAGGAP